MAGFWQKWLMLWCVAVAVFGLVLAGGAFAATDGITRGLLVVLGHPWPAVPDAHHRFSVGLMGAVTLGWGATLMPAFRALGLLDPRQAAPLWRTMTLAILGWFVIDSAISIATGFWLNAVSNTLLVILFLVPVVRGGVLRSAS